MSMTMEDIHAIARSAAQRVLQNLTPVEKVVESESAVEEKPTQEEPKACPNLLPMAEWIKGDDPDTCRPCTLTPVVQWYYTELKEKGFTELAADLEAEVDVLEDDNVEQIKALCKDLDAIKAQVPAELRKRLEEFDCSIQSYDVAELSDPAGEVPAEDSPSSSQPHADTPDSESESPQ
jgi:hypothetical protein